MVYRTLPLTLNPIDMPPTGLAEQCTDSSAPAASESLASHAVAAADDDSATWLVFFSPSGVAAATEAFSAARVLACHRAAIGPTTAAALADAQMHAHAVAERPAPDALRAAIERAITASGGATAI
jgi:uroporphyrinogen-III synthase